MLILFDKKHEPANLCSFGLLAHSLAFFFHMYMFRVVIIVDATFVANL